MNRIRKWLGVERRACLPFEKEYARRQRKLRGSRWIVGLLLVPVFIVLLACNPMTVTQRFPDGSPKAVTEYVGFHIDYDEVTPTDNFCASTGVCLFWDSPKQRYWHQHWYHDYIGPQGRGYWIHNPGEWHNYKTCEAFKLLETNPECWEAWPGTIRG